MKGTNVITLVFDYFVLLLVWFERIASTAKWMPLALYENCKLCILVLNMFSEHTVWKYLMNNKNLLKVPTFHPNFWLFFFFCLKVQISFQWHEYKWGHRQIKFPQMDKRKMSLVENQHSICCIKYFNFGFSPNLNWKYSNIANVTYKWTQAQLLYKYW